MTIADCQDWFDRLARADKVSALLIVMHSFSIAMRSVSLDFPDDCTLRWRLAYHLSEINHALTAAARALLAGEETYPSNVLMEMILDQKSYPELEGPCRIALDEAMKLLNGKNISA